MALLNYKNLEQDHAGTLLDDVFGGLKPFMDFLSRTKKFLESDEAILRVAWRPVEPERRGTEDGAKEDPCRVELVEPEDRPNLPDGIFRSFLDEGNRSVYEHTPVKEGGDIKQPKAGRFERNHEIEVLDRDPRNNRLQLIREPAGPELLLHPNTDNIKKQMRALAAMRDMPHADHQPTDF